MKYLYAILAACAGFTFAQCQSEGKLSNAQLNGRAERFCDELENVDMKKCTQGARECVTLLSKRTGKSDGDQFWDEVRKCTSFQVVSKSEDTLKNIISLFSKSKIFSCETQNEALICDTTTLDPNNPRVTHQVSELPQICAKYGGCEVCKMTWHTSFECMLPNNVAAATSTTQQASQEPTPQANEQPPQPPKSVDQQLKDHCGRRGNDNDACLYAARRCRGQVKPDAPIQEFLQCVDRMQVCADQGYNMDKCVDNAKVCKEQEKLPLGDLAKLGHCAKKNI